MQVFLLGCFISVKPYLKERGRFSLGKMSGPVTWIAFTWSVIAVCIFTLPTVWPIEGKHFKQIKVTAHLILENVLQQVHLIIVQSHCLALS